MAKTYEQPNTTSNSNNQSQTTQAPPYPTAAALPTQQAPKNIRFDFNEGCRVHLPLLEEAEGTWRIELTDLDTGNILFAQAGLNQALVRSSKRWYVRFGRILKQKTEKLPVRRFSPTLTIQKISRYSSYFLLEHWEIRWHGCHMQHALLRCGKRK